MDDASIIELFRERNEQAIVEIKRKYGKLCFYIAGNILSLHEDIEEYINSAYYEIWNNIPPDNHINSEVQTIRPPQVTTKVPDNNEPSEEFNSDYYYFQNFDAISDNVSAFSDTFRIYGAGSAEDIESIFVSVTIPNGSVMETASQSTITDRNKIKDITDVLYQLNPEARTDALSGSPEWLNNAWDAYRANPDAFTREDITLDITFKNGAVLKGISYQPYLGNGYVSGMQELTHEQNCLLRELLK